MNSREHTTLADVFGQQYFDLRIRDRVAVTEDEKAVVDLLSPLDYRRFGGRRGRPLKADPLCMMILLVYGATRGAFSCRDLEDLLGRDVFLLKVFGGTEVGHNTINRFQKENAEAIEDVFRQMVLRLDGYGELGKDMVFQDGTKVESYANKYTFRWKGFLEKMQARARGQARELIGDAEALGVHAGGGGLEDRLRSVAEATGRAVGPAAGKGRRKNPLWRLHDKAASLLERLEGYRQALETIGDGRRSCSKTDPEATFMRLKEDAMRNGQLKPAYNVQNAVDGGYVVCCTVSQDRTDYRTAVGMLEKLGRSFPWKYRAYCADSGYDTLENYRYCEEHGITAYIKPQYWEQRKKRSWRKDPGRAENMDYDPRKDTFTCARGHKLAFTGERRHRKGDLEETRSYECRRGCRSCPLRKLCLRRKIDRETGYKHLDVMLGHLRARKKAEVLLATREGVEARLNRSIQAEGSFAEAKRNLGLRRFSSGGMQRVLTEWTVRAMAQDVIRFACRRAKGLVGNPFWISAA